ncbi:MAG: diaminobutyrate--2-oxoglutarate transaminase [Clostridia bacterium]|nr:diaminobutyrate--2-oxoglutarate transaminase [Clostridia bacterium]MBO5432611.1 diaminobutyrate--2-oxoglutarate transaminase [Clostridia bacterium]MBP3560186.1 diaminobutyrate--2-oxoglutarate transaminase [Clostridia bacterium]MBQ6837295.1 diaminobutyrate--2-oxoglutarate transaminase [Clostridia bacterium]
MNTSVFEKYESEVRSYCRNFPAVFTKAKGSYIFAEDGKEYIDFFCGAGALNYGHNNDYIKSRIIDYLESDGIIHSLDMFTSAKRDFIEFFESKVLEPRGFNYKIQFPGPTGTNAVEAALKLARKVKKRNNIFAFMGAFHGMTLGSLSMTTDRDSREGAGVVLTDVTHIPTPYMFPELDVLKYMQTLIDDDHSGISKPAAVFVEPVQADGGIHVFSVEFLKGLREFCTRNDILLVCDDIQVGSARTGTYFSFERAGIVPDIVTLSKSIGGYGMPFALVLFKPELDVWNPGEHNGTFRGSQLSIVAAKAGLEIMLESNVEAEVRRKGEIIAEYLGKVKEINESFDVRGIGFMWGVDCNKVKPDAVSRAIVKECFENGLIVERAGRNNDVVKLMPCLLADDETLKKGLDIFVNAVKKVMENI